MHITTIIRSLREEMKKICKNQLTTTSARRFFVLDLHLFALEWTCPGQKTPPEMSINSGSEWEKMQQLADAVLAERVVPSAQRFNALLVQDEPASSIADLCRSSINALIRYSATESADKTGVTAGDKYVAHMAACLARVSNAVEAFFRHALQAFKACDKFSINKRWPVDGMSMGVADLCWAYIFTAASQSDREEGRGRVRAIGLHQQLIDEMRFKLRKTKK